jgi:rubrerythrin
VTTEGPSLLDRSSKLDLSGIDFDAFTTSPLDPDSLRCLRYMHDVEHHTVCYLRDLLVTRAHLEPAVTDFLACWTYEEHWHGEALGKVLASHGLASGPTSTTQLRQRLPRSDRLRPVFFSLVSTMSRHLVALQMAWGAVNELTTQAGYRRLSAKAANPVLSELLGRIMRQEGRHIDFYLHQARARLSGNPRARRVVRTALALLWAPVGSGVKPKDEVRFLVTHLFAGADGMSEARRVDRQVDRIPGLAGLDLVQKALIKAA